MLDLHRYDKVIMYDDYEIDKKIKALLILYDYESEKLTGHFNKMKHVNHYIETLIKHEEYECLKQFKLKKKALLDSYKKKNRTKWLKLKIFLRSFVKTYKNLHSRSTNR